MNPNQSSNINNHKQVKGASDHRTTCHRCGNIRKDAYACTECPYIFCVKCVEKMKQEHGKSTFMKGCPVCKNLCCCADKSESCHKIHHCYKKCPSTVNPNYVRPCQTNRNSGAKTTSTKQSHGTFNPPKISINKKQPMTINTNSSTSSNTSSTANTSTNTRKDN